MDNKKRLIFLVFTLSFCLIIYIFLPGGRKEEPLWPAELFNQGRYEESFLVLEQSRKSLPDAAYYLYKSYITRELGDLNGSDNALKAALLKLQGKQDLHLLPELHLNLLLNAYLMKNDQELKNRLFQARKLITDDRGWLPIFSGIACYRQEVYEEALDAFSASEKRDYLNSWMRTAFEKVFTPYWFDKHRAYSLIECGQWDQAREILTVWEDRTLTEKEIQELHFLCGMSYFFESKSKDGKAAYPLIVKAFACNEKADKNGEAAQAQFNDLLEHLKRRIAQEIQAKDFRMFGLYLNEWEKRGSNEQVHAIAVQLDEFLTKNPSYLGKIIPLLQGSALKIALEEKYKKRLWSKIIENTPDEIAMDWGFAYAFSSDETGLQKQCVAQLEKTLLNAVQVTDRKQNDPFISLYRSVQNDQGACLLFAEKIADLGEGLWNRPERRQQALNALEIAVALSFPQNAAAFHEGLERRFQKLHKNAVRMSNIDDLQDLVAAAERLEIASLAKENNKELLGQLEDAEFLYSSGRLEEAKRKGEWVLQVDPLNQRGRRLLGMIAYYMADYQLGLDYMQDLSLSSTDMTEALGVMEILQGDPQKGENLLEEVRKERPVRDEAYLRLAFGHLTQGSPIEALKMLEKIEKQTDESLAGKVFAAHLANSWTEALELSKQLKAPYVALDGYKGLVIEAQIALGDVEKARFNLEDLLRSPPQSNEDLTSYFLVFKERKLDQWNRNFIAALFYKEVDSNLNKSLIYFDKIQNPSPIAEVEKSEVLMRLNRGAEAKNILQSVHQKIGASVSQEELLAKVLPLLGETYVRLGDYEEAQRYYGRYFLLEAANDVFRAPYIESLKKIHRYDLALEQLEILSENQSLSDQEALSQIDCLVHLDRFAQADKAAGLLMYKKDVPLTVSLQLARSMIITQNKGLLERIQEKIPEPSQRSLEDNLELILLWTDQGFYNEAVELSQLLEKKLVESTKGSLALARLYIKLGRLDKALEFAEKALEADPSDPEAMDFIEAHTKTYETLARMTRLLEDELKEDPENLSLQIKYANSLMDLAIESYLAGNIKQIENSAELKQARTLLQRLVKGAIALPKVHFLLGKSAFILDLNEEAVANFQSALNIDPSYTEALQNLALVYEEEGRIEEATAALRQAVKFEPSNAGIWEQLSDISSNAGKDLDAIGALQTALRYDPFEPSLYIKLSRLYLKTDNAAGAVEILDGLLSIDPQNVDGLKLMLRALFAPGYEEQVQDLEFLRKRRIEIYDRLKFEAPEQAIEALPPGVDLEPK